MGLGGCPLGNGMAWTEGSQGDWGADFLVWGLSEGPRRENTGPASRTLGSKIGALHTDDMSIVHMFMCVQCLNAGVRAP